MKRRRHARASTGPATTNPEELPIGSIVWLYDQGWVVVPGGMAPTSIMSGRAGAYVPEGEHVWSAGATYTLIGRGNGVVPTKSTADRKIDAWWKATRR